MPRLVEFANLLAVLGLGIVLLAAYGFQFALGELPCPLCTLQRIAFALTAFGFVMNLRFGAKPAHYGLIILAALFGMTASGRQVMLHIVPGSGAYGSAVLGLHFYSWAFILFGLVVLGVAVLLLMGVPAAGTRHKPGVPVTAAAFLVIALVLANAVTTFVQCGPIECPDDPTSYWLFSR